MSPDGKEWEKEGKDTQVEEITWQMHRNVQEHSTCNSQVAKEEMASKGKNVDEGEAVERARF